MSKLIVRNIYQSFQCGNDTSGLGDFLRGCLFINSLSSKYDFITEINIKCNYQLDQLIETNSTWIKPDCINLCDCIRDNSIVEKLINEAKNDNLKELNIFTTAYPYIVTNENCTFLLNNFKPRKILDDYITEYLSKNKLEKYNYEIIQVRLSDLLFSSKKEKLSDNLIKIITTQLKKIILKKHNYIITGTYENLLKETNLLSEYKNLYSTNIKTIHIGKIKRDVSIDLVKDTLLEFFLNFYSNRIININHYWWASNFTKWIGFINNIDYDYIQIYDFVLEIEKEYIKKLSNESYNINKIANNNIELYKSYKEKLRLEFNEYKVFNLAESEKQSKINSNSFQLHNFPYQRMLFADIFIKNNELILISQIYYDILFNFNEVEIILDNNNELININKFDQILPIEDNTTTNTHEAYNVIKYKLPIDKIKKDNINTFFIRYKNQKYLYNIIPIKNIDIKTEFTIATLFKDDHYQIPMFYNYYKKQGVTKFILFYNGNIKKVDHLLFKAPEIEYNSWNYDYYMDDVTSWEKTDEFKKRTKSANIHHAQSLLLTMIRYKYFKDTRYLLLNDLDEYFHVPNETLITYLKRTNKTMYQVKNYWAKLKNKIIDDTEPKGNYHFDINSLKSIEVETNPSIYENKFYERTKMIYRNDAMLNYKGTIHEIDSFNVHLPRPWIDDLYTKSSPLLVENDEIKMYQFLNLDDRNREIFWSKDLKLTINLLK
jgi:hypothetical protein